MWNESESADDAWRGEERTPPEMPKPATLDSEELQATGFDTTTLSRSPARCQAAGVGATSEAASASPIGEPRPVQASQPRVALKTPFVPDVTSRKRLRSDAR